MFMLNGHEARITCLSMDEQGRILISGDQRGQLVWWDLESRTQLFRIDLGNAIETGIIARDGNFAVIATGSIVSFWNTASRERVRDDMKSDEIVTCLAIDSFDRTLAIGSADSSYFRLVNLDSGHIQMIPSKLKGIQSLTFSTEGSKLALGAVDGVVAVYDCEISSFIADLHPEMSAGLFGTTNVSLGPHGDRVGHGESVTSVAFSPDGRYLASGSTDCSVFVWETKNWRAKNLLQGHFDTVSSIAFSGETNNLITGSADGSVKIWDPSTESNKPISVLKSWDRTFATVALSRGGNLFATLGNAEGITLWDTDSGEAIGSLPDVRDEIEYLQFAETPILAAATSNEVFIWDTETKKRICSISLADEKISKLAVSRIGNIIAIVTSDQGVTLWRASNGEKLGSLVVQDGIVTAVALSDDGRTLAVGFENGLIKLGNVKLQTFIAQLRGHPERINSITFSPDDRTIASCGSRRDDNGNNIGSVRLWDASTGRRLLTFPFSSSVSRVDFSRSGDILLALLEGGKTQLWFRGSRERVDTLWSKEMKHK